MKAKNKDPKGMGSEKTRAPRKHTYYFHADEDFREDHNWKNDLPSENVTLKEQSKSVPKNSSKVF